MVKRALCALGVSVAGAAAAAPPCATEVEVEPRTAFVGQQVVYRLRILRKSEVTSVRFADELAFPSFRVEWLPGQTLDPKIDDVGEHALVVEERRALFPARAGALAIPAARLECRTARGTSEAAVPATAVDVREPPAATDLVGPVAMTAHLARDRIELGESVRLTVTLRGEGNVWGAPSPVGAIEGLDVHPRAPELERSAGKRLALTQSFAYDLVPRSAGVRTIPALRVDWLDPATGRRETSETAALQLDVAAPARAEEPAPAPSPTRVAVPQAPPPIRSWALLAMLFAIALGLFLVVRRLRARTTPARAAASELAAAAEASRRGDRAAERAALAAALRAALAVHRPEARSLAAEELVARTDGAERDAAEALLALDQARFGAGHGPPAPDPARVRTLLASL
jgi:hypothetical protein